MKAYHEFRERVDFTHGGFLPDLDNLIWYLLIGVPPVPADDDRSEEGQLTALDQRLNILKAVFVELNREMPDAFLDEGLTIYDQAGASTRDLLTSASGIEMNDTVQPVHKPKAPESSNPP